MRSPLAPFRAVLCLSTALMMAVCWPLWVAGGQFPRVPFVVGLRGLPAWGSWARFGLLLAAMGAASAGARWRLALGVALGLSAWMILEDQFRLQPWMYQFLLMGLALAACPERQAMRLGRLFVIAMYFHSGLSKLDTAFAYRAGPEFLRALEKVLHVDIPGTPSEQAGLVLAMPCWELAIAAFLTVRLRRLGVVMAVAQHLVLLLILGPWGLNHSLNVLLWNLALIPEVVLLFLGGQPAEPLAESPRRLASVARGALIAAAILPLFERAGWWDTWPSFGLYASGNERVEFQVLRAEAREWPGPVLRHEVPLPIGSDSLWVEIGLKDWSLAERRVPLYPSARALSGVAEALAARHGGPRAVRLVVYGRADRWTERRKRDEFLGLEAIRRHADSYWLNAHPAP